MRLERCSRCEECTRHACCAHLVPRPQHSRLLAAATQSWNAGHNLLRTERGPWTALQSLIAELPRHACKFDPNTQPRGLATKRHETRTHREIWQPIQPLVARNMQNLLARSLNRPAARRDCEWRKGPSRPGTFDQRTNAAESMLVPHSPGTLIQLERTSVINYVFSITLSPFVSDSTLQISSCLSPLPRPRRPSPTR